MTAERTPGRNASSSMVPLARLLQLSDPTLPIGSFAFSNGLESALQTGVVSDQDDLLHYVKMILRQSARMDGVALLHTHRAVLGGHYDSILTADSELFCRRVGEEQQLMLTRVGKKFAELMSKINPSPTLMHWLSDIKANATPGCLPIGQAIMLVHNGIDEADAFVMHQFGIASMILSAALRLMRIDHLATQYILFMAQAGVEDEYCLVRDLSLDEMTSFNPVYDVLVAHHTTTHARLFMS
jgi:urease accessory protein